MGTPSTREEYSMDGLNWTSNDGDDWIGPFDPSIYLFKRVRDLQSNRVLRFDNLVSTQAVQAAINSDIATCHPPTICGVESCMNDAYVTIYIGAGELIGICPSCMEQIIQAQAGVRLPEQRAHVIDLHSREARER